MRRIAATVLAVVAPSAALAADVTPIAPQPILDAVSVSAGDGVAGYVRAAHMFGVVAVSAIAVVMVVWGAILVFGESVTGKKGGKEKIWNAVWGLLLAAGSYVILGTISTSLLSTDFGLSDIGKLGADATTATEIGAPGAAISGKDLIGSSVASGGSDNRPAGTGDWSGFTPDPSLSPSEQLARAAEYAATNNIRSCDGPGGGNVACVFMARQIFNNARIVFDSGTNYTPTAREVLDTSSNFSFVGTDLSQARRGDVVVSPTGDDEHEYGGPSDSGTGHFGFIVRDGGASIVSNSSTPARVEQNYDATSWRNRFSDNGIYIYRPR
jgi:hypothetical protein